MEMAGSEKNPKIRHLRHRYSFDIFDDFDAMTFFSEPRQVMMASTPNWFDLPVDLKFDILGRIGAPDVLENAQRVCTDWYKICKDPSMWRVINLDNLTKNGDSARLLKMSKHAVHRSQGQLVDITFPKLKADETDEFLLYVADSASQLKRLTVSCSAWGYSFKSLREALKKFPLLEELTVYSVCLFTKVIEIAARYCPLLKTLTIDHEPHGSWNTQVPLYDGLAIAIGENLHDLRHLTLLANGISNIGLQVILDGCPHLESLDLTMCWNIDLKGDIVNRCKNRLNVYFCPTNMFVLKSMAMISYTMTMTCLVVLKTSVIIITFYDDER